MKIIFYEDMILNIQISQKYVKIIILNSLEDQKIHQNIVNYILKIYSTGKV